MSDKTDPKPILPNTPPPDPPPPPPGVAPTDPAPAPDVNDPEAPTHRKPLRSRPDGWDQHDAVTIRDSAVRALAPLRQGPASPVGHHAGFGPAGFGTVLI